MQLLGGSEQRAFDRAAFVTLATKGIKERGWGTVSGQLEGW